MARVVVTSAAYLGDVAPFVGPANELVNWWLVGTE
jgi:hypothetical protein